jgi:hypothetical protein
MSRPGDAANRENTQEHAIVTGTVTGTLDFVTRIMLPMHIGATRNSAKRRTLRFTRQMDRKSFRNQ